MFELDNTNKDNPPTDDRVSLTSLSKREVFLEWLSVGNAKKYSPSVCVDCLDKISEYALRKKISLISIWDITKHNAFQPVYNRLLEAKLLRITKKNTYKIFIVAGQLYLKFLKEKPWTRKATTTEDVAGAGIEKGKDESLKPMNPDDVIAWLVTQPNVNGTLYLENVARLYISALRSAPPKLALTLENRDVFSCHTVAELDALCDTFRSASNYKTVNSVTSGSLSAGLAAYRRYLEHLSAHAENINSGNLVSFHQPNIGSEATDFFAATVMDDEYLYSLRDEFRNYIRQQHPEWADSTVDMHKSDAYFLKNNDVGICLTEALANEEALLVARDKIRDYLRDVNKVGNPENSANGYLRTLRMFKEFLSARAELNMAVTIETQKDTSMGDKINTYPRRVDFRNTSSCAGCDPIICVICGENIDVGTWRDILVTLTEKFIRENYPNVNDLYARPLLQGSTRPFLLRSKPNGSARQLSNGYWVFMNYGISTLVDLIGKICMFCDIDLSNVEIEYVPKKGGFAPKPNGRESFNAVHIPEAVLEVLTEDYRGGLVFNAPSIRLLEDKVGLQINDALQGAMKQTMFRRNDDVYFPLANIITDDNIELLFDVVDEWLYAFGCFELVALYDIFRANINENVIRNLTDFEDLFNHLNNQSSLRCVGQLNTKIVRMQKFNVNESLMKVAGLLLHSIHNDFGGIADEIGLKEKFSAFSESLIANIIKEYAEEIVKTEINGIVCYQTLDALGLSDDFSEVLERVMSRFEELGLTPTEEALHTALSFDMGLNFKEEFNIPDQKTYRRLIAYYYKSAPGREWRKGEFVEVQS